MNPLLVAFHRLGSPPTFYALARRLEPWLWATALLAMGWGLWAALFLVPPDYQQGDGFRLLFVHVPSAWMSLFIYMVMAACALVAVVWRIKLAEIMLLAAAPIGAGFTLVTLATGSIWGRPMWNTWWVWDARLTSELVLFFLYVGVLALAAAIPDRRRAARAAAFLALVGVINLPIIHYSVQWWNTLHQGATIRLIGPSTLDPSMVAPLIAMVIGTKCWFLASWLLRSRAALITREADRSWAQAAVGPAA